MTTVTVTPEQQLQQMREALWEREYALQARGVPAREIMELVRAQIRLWKFEQQVARGEAGPVEYEEGEEDW